MGFDIECIIDIQKYPGEYFCPVCRTLVYPNEALQSQCTHLYCKPCLAHVANNTRACPYDGYLVTESDSKLLIESDKALAENIGKVKVRCLYHRSGCTWEGPLSECTLHCSGCSFGSSPVICNRCGVQIVHRQVHDHAQSCPGVYQVQQADAAQVVASSGLTAATGAANQNQATSQAGAPTSKAQISHIAPPPLVPGQNSNQQANANSQAPATVPTTDQWYQQQYQQYYQQYAGYDPYQQAYTQYYPYQQLAVQQYPPQVLGQQPQIQVYAQAAAQVQPPSSSQPQVHPQTQSQPLNPGQPIAQAQPPPQPHPVQSQIKTQSQVQPHGATLIHSQPLAPQGQNQVQANPQQLPHPAVQSHAQIPAQANSIPGLPAPQTQHYNQPQAQPQPQPQPHPVQPQPQHVQAQYQQPHLPMHHPQPSLVHLQSHMLTQTQPQAQPQPQPQSQPHPQLQPQPQPQVQPQPQLQPHLRPSLPNQPTVPSAQPQPLPSSGHAVSGYQSYLQPQPPQQQPIPAHPASVSLPSGQMQGQVFPQPPLMRPPSQVPVLNQQQAQFQSQVQVSSMTTTQQQQFHPQAPQLSHPNQQHPVIHSNQHGLPQQYAQQQPFSNSAQGQLSHHNLVQQQSQLHPQGPPPMMQQSFNAYPQLQQNVANASVVQSQQPHNYVGRPLMPHQGAPSQPQPFQQSSSGFISGAQIRPGQFGPYQQSPNQNYANKTNNQLLTASDQQILQSGMTSTSGVLLRQGDGVSDKTNVVFEAGLPSQNDAEKVANASRVDSVEMKPLKSDVGISYEQDAARESTENSRKSESLVRDAGSELHGGIDGSGQPLTKLPLREERVGYSLEHSSDVKSNEVAKQRDTIGDVRTDDVEPHKDQKAIFVKAGDESLQASTGPVNQQKSAGPPILQSGPPVGPPSRTQLPGYPAMPGRPQGSGLLPQPRQPLNSNEQFQSPLLRQPHDVLPGGIPALGSTATFGRAPVPFGPPQGPALTALPPGSADPRGGIMGRAPQHGPAETEMLPKQRQSHFDGEHTKIPGSFERGPLGHPSGVEPNALRMNGKLGLEKSSLGSQDDRFKALPGEHLNPFTREPTWPRDLGSRPLDRGPHGLNYDARPTLDSAGGGPASRMLPPFHPSGGPGMARHDVEHLVPRSPDREYLGMKAHSHGEGSRRNLPLDPQGNPILETRFLPLPGYQQRGDHEGPEALRYGEHRVPGPQDHIRRTDLFGQDIPPSHFRRGELLGPGNSTSNFGPFPGHTQMGEISGPTNLPHNFQYGEPFAGDKPGGQQLGEPGSRGSFSLQGFPSDGPYAGDMSTFDNSRKRKNMSMGWCRICKVDCETVEGLDRHSQSREHQKMSLDMVMSIKLQNKKKFKASNDRAGRELGNKKRNFGQEGRGKKP
ncbi:unnamed protein product [Coffea canephora]|uniref:DH200=94 genomic scaffold, scaffold_1828 n=1 Tax=Coffea canephora TaxID=49390 RepID=A0A068VJ29_COFCA|nr:unnamed protein product [Coffea canephora]